MQVTRFPVLFISLLFATSSLYAQDSAPAVEGQGFWYALMDNALGISILFIFISAIITAIVQARKKDRVLKDFNGYDVTVVLENGKRVWGLAQVFPNGIVLHYRKPYIDPDGNTKNSFILHASEFAAVRAILRRDQDLRPKLRQRRADEFRRFQNPTVYRRFKRWLSIQLSILRDALVKSIALLIGQAKKKATPNSTVGSIVSSQEGEITKSTSTVVGAAWDLANDPILESLYSRPCYAEMKIGDGWQEMSGILKEYSPQWVGLLDSIWPLEAEAVLPPGARKTRNAESNCMISRDGNVLIIENDPPEEVEVCEVLLDGETFPIERMRIGGGSSARLNVPDSENSTIRIKLTSYEPADVILPRGTTLVRHRGEKRRQSFRSKLGLQSGHG